MLEQFWQYGILAAVLIFGLKIGLALGFSGIEKKKVLLILVGYGVALTIFSSFRYFSKASSPFAQSL